MCGRGELPRDLVRGGELECVQLQAVRLERAGEFERGFFRRTRGRRFPTSCPCPAKMASIANGCSGGKCAAVSLSEPW